VSRRQGPAPLEAYVLLIEIYQKRGEPFQVMATIDALIKQYPGDPRAAGLLLRIAQSQVTDQGLVAPGRLPFVRQVTDRILAYYPGSPAAPAARRLQGQIDRRQGRRGGRQD
jgi:hypothetical protein